MGQVTYRDGIAVLQLGVLAPAILFCIGLCLRHGFQACWWLLIMFALARVVGAVAQLISIDHPGVGATVTVLITLYLGVAPLILSVWTMLLRLNSKVARPMPILVYRVLAWINIAALGFGAYGSYKIASDALRTGQNHMNGFAIAAIIIFTIIYALSIVFLTYLWAQFSTVENPRERITHLAASLAIPLLGVKIIYILICAFAHNASFNVYNGSNTIYLCMSVLEEIGVIYIFIIAGFLLPPWKHVSRGRTEIEGSSSQPLNPSSTQSPTYAHKRGSSSSSTKRYEKSRGRQHVQQPKRPSRAKQAKGPITWLYYTVADARR